MEPIEYPCPVCGSETEWSPDCPGYGKDPVWTCHPVCGNADEYTCTNDECNWWYREPNNRSDKAQMGVAPIWLERRSWMPDEDDE